MYSCTYVLMYLCTHVLMCYKRDRLVVCCVEHHFCVKHHLCVGMIERIVIYLFWVEVLLQRCALVLLLICWLMILICWCCCLYFVCLSYWSSWMSWLCVAWMRVLCFKNVFDTYTIARVTVLCAVYLYLLDTVCFFCLKWLGGMLWFHYPICYPWSFMCVYHVCSDTFVSECRCWMLVSSVHSIAVCSVGCVLYCL